MGIISIEKSNRLIWLGRYTERAFTIARTLMYCYDDMIDKDEFAYRLFLDRLGLPYIYGSREVFINRYFFDPEDPNSLVSSMGRALDNGIVMREELTSESLCYLQMSLDALLSGKDSSAPLLVLQDILDNILSFWGAADDYMFDEDCRNLMKSGKYVERMDLYVRLCFPYRDLEKEVRKLVSRLHKVKFAINEASVQRIIELTADEETYLANKNEILRLLCTVLA